MKWLISTLLCALLIGVISAECTHPSAQMKDFCISEESFNENRIVTFYVSSFDFNTGESNIDFFRYRIVRDYDNSGSPLVTNLLLNYTISIYSPTLGFHSKTDLFEGTLKVLNVNDDVIIHNSDFSAYTTDISGFSVIPQIDAYPNQIVMDNMVSTIM